MEDQALKLLLVDDDPMILRALGTILESEGFEVIGTVQDARDAERQFDLLQPDLLIMDIRMPEISGLDIARNILAKDPAASILLLTTFKDEQWLSEALALGCRGYLLKQNFGSIVPAIRAVAAGNHVFDQEVVVSLKDKSEVTPDPRLSERENEVMVLVAQGMNNREIGEELHLSEGTVRNYLSAILEKLSLRDRTQIAIYYYRKLLQKRPF